MLRCRSSKDEVTHKWLALGIIKGRTILLYSVFDNFFGGEKVIW